MSNIIELYLYFNVFFMGFASGLFWEERKDYSLKKWVLFQIILFFIGVLVFVYAGIVELWDTYLYKSFKRTKAYEVFERIKLWYKFVYLKKPMTSEIDSLESLKNTLTRRKGSRKHHLFKRFLLNLINNRIKQLEDEETAE